MTYICKYARFRPGPEPSRHIPLGARSVGQHTVPPGWRDRRFRVEHVVFLWGIRGTGFIEFDQSPAKLPPDHLGVYMPGDLQAIQAGDEAWEYYWWTVDGAQAARLVEGFGFTTGIYPAGTAPLTQIKQLDSIIERPGRDNEIDAAVIAYGLLSWAAQFSIARPASEHDEKLVNEAIRIILQSWQDPAFSVDTLADALGVHRSTLSRRFRRVAGATVIGYINTIRMSNARHLLQHTHDPIYRIATRCGFRDSNYFAKQFKAQFKISPSAFKRTNEP